MFGQRAGAGGLAQALGQRGVAQQPGDRIGQALFTGDFFVTPPRVIFDLEARLRGVLAAKAKRGQSG